MSEWSLANKVIANPSCFICDAHCVRRALAFADARAGSNIAARIAMIAITTSNSISVKPLLVHEDDFPVFANRILFSVWGWGNFHMSQRDKFVKIAVQLAADHRVVQFPRQLGE